MVRSTHKNRPLTIRLFPCYSSTIATCTFVDGEVTVILERVVADPVVGIGRDVGQIDGTERRPHLEATRERLGRRTGSSSRTPGRRLELDVA